MLLPILVIVELLTCGNEQRVVVVHHHVILVLNTDIALKKLVDIVNLFDMLGMIAPTSLPGSPLHLILATSGLFLAAYMS